ncbi:MAG: response regulator [Ignavibacteriaceae bacterium]
MVNSEKLKILVVDDSDIIRYSLKNFFEDYNLDVITCLNGLEGIQKAIEHKPRLIFLDIMMPNFDGIKMLQVIKLLDDLKAIPVIVISANTDKKNVMAVLEAGADRVITKPLQKEVIISYIREILGNDFLISAKERKPSLSDKDNQEIKSQLLKFFLHGFAIKEKAIIDAFETRNVSLLKTVFHELRGVGGTIGYQRITDISADLENSLSSFNINWFNLKTKCDELFKLVKEIKDSNKNLVGE